MKLFRGLIFLLCAATVAYQSSAQFEGSIYRTDGAFLSKIKVTADGKEKKMAWCGGVNNPQFATPDLNHDGKNDLVIFEQYGYYTEKGIKTFINNGTSGNPDFAYAPEYEYLFPYIAQYFKMIDYNCDSVPDIFHFGNSGVGVCDGFYNAFNILAFRNCRDIFYLYPGSQTGPSNVGIPGSTIPAIVDVDNDGDLDILTYANSGSVIYLFRNQKAEKGYKCDTIGLQLRDLCWGRVLQGSQRAHYLNLVCDNSITNNQPKKTDGSNNLCLFDADGDGDYDILDGNSQYSDLQFLSNNRIQSPNNKLDSMTWQDTLWQSNGQQAYMPRFPLATWIDIDQDGDKDILVSPIADLAENYKSIAFYKNIGSDANPVFAYINDTFLVDRMIDLGANSYPIFYDYNRDGKKDLFIGSKGFLQPNGTFKPTIYYYQNTSSGSSISFDLVTRNFLSIDTVSDAQGASLAIGDIDNDGLDDLLVGRLDGTITYYKNTAGTASGQPNWQFWQRQLRDLSATEIDAGNYAAPLIYDINKDGKKDLIIGNQSGYLSYYENTGSIGLKLEYRTNKLGDVRTIPDPSTMTYGFSAPFIGKMDNTNKEYLVVGSQYGTIFRYDGFQNGNVTTPYTMIDSQYSYITIPGGNIAPTIVDLDEDGKYEMFIGNDKGGVFAYRQFWNVDVKDIPQQINTLEVYPNPAKNILMAKADHEIPRGVEVKIYNTFGQVVRTGTTIDGNIITADISALEPGIYLLGVYYNGEIKTARFTKLP